MEPPEAFTEFYALPPVFLRLIGYSHLLYLVVKIGSGQLVHLLKIYIFIDRRRYSNYLAAAPGGFAVKLGRIEHPCSDIKILSHDLIPEAGIYKPVDRIFFRQRDIYIYAYAGDRHIAHRTGVLPVKIAHGTGRSEVYGNPQSPPPVLKPALIIAFDVIMPSGLWPVFYLGICPDVGPS